MAGYPIVHIDLVTKDPHGTANFYQQLFGWKIESDPNFADYPMFLPESGPAGGFTKGEHDQKPGDILLYTDTEDLDETVARAVSLGGVVVVPKSDIPGIGFYAVIAEPGGTKMGIYTQLKE